MSAFSHFQRHTTTHILTILNELSVPLPTSLLAHALSVTLTCAPSTHPNSLLCKFLLCIKMTMYHKDIVFVVMNNVFPPQVPIHERYDMKVGHFKCYSTSNCISHHAAVALV